MSQEEILAFLNSGDLGQVFLFRFTDGAEVELSDLELGATKGGNHEVIATVVRSASNSDVAAGSSICFALRDVSDVRLSSRPFEYFR